MSTIVAQTLSNGTVSTSTANCIQGSAKAWVRATATGGTPTINGSYNVSSITYSATGIFAVNFTNAMPNANYSYLASVGQNGVTTQIDGESSTTSCGFGTYNASFAGFNPASGARICCIVLGN